MASSDEEDLEALRNAALATLRRKQEEQAPQGIQVVSAIPQQGLSNPEELLFTSEYDEIPLEVERLFLRQQGRGRGKFQRGRGRGRGRGGFDPNFNPNPNVIVIPTLPIEGEEDEKKKEKKTFFLRPQDKWAMKDTGSASSSPKIRDTSKFRRYDDDTDSDEEDEEANKTTHDSEHELKTGDNSDVRNIHVGEIRSGCENMEQNYYENISEGEIKTSELSQTRSDIEAALETVSEVESDVYYENSAQLGKTVEAVDKPPEDKTAVNQPDLNSSEEFQSDKLYREIPVKDSGFSDEKLEIKGTFQESDTHLDENASEHTMHRTLETVKDNNILGIEKEIENTGCDTDTVHTSKAESAEIERLSPEMSENDSKLPSSKFSRFNRKRRNSSGSESDGSDYSDVSSWSTSHQSPFNFESKPHDNSKSDVSSTPFSQGHISGKELPDNMESESASESDSDSSSSSDESSASSSSSFKSSNEKYEKVTSKTKPASSLKEKSELYKSAEHSHKQNSLRLPEVGSRENEYRKSDLLQRRVSGTGDKRDDIHLKPAEKKESFNSAKVTSGKSKGDEKGLKKVQSDTYFHENSQNYSSGRQIKDKAEKVKQVGEAKSKSAFNRHEDTKYFEQISDKNIKKEPVKQIFPIQLEEDYKTTGIEQIVLDARRQKLGKETRTVSLTGSEQKDTSETTFHSHTESVASKSYDRDDSHHSSMKDKSAVSKDYFDSTKHEKSSRYRKSRSRTPPKAYLKAKNKKTEQKVLKRFGSISPPKAYSKDLKKMEKRRKSSHSGERKRKHSGSLKKTRRSDSKKIDSATDSGKSISSLSDSDSDSETENWRDKKSGVSRKRDDIERERRMRLAAEKETDRKERKESDSVKDRQHKDRKEERYSGRSDGREGKSKTEIDSFDARDYRQQIAWDDRHRSRRDVLDRRPHERVFYRKNKTFVEEEPMFNKTHFEEEVSDDSKHDNKQGIASVIKPNRKRLSSEADLEDIKISRKHSKHKHEDLNKKVKKERLIISVQESSGDEKQTKSEKVRKSDSRKKKSKHKSHDKNTSGESDSVREEQLVKVIFTEDKERKPRKSVYDRLGDPVSKAKDTMKQGGSSTSRIDRDKSSRSKGKDHSKSRERDRKESSSSAIRRVYREEESGDRRDALNAKIQKIQEKNAEILKRKQEIEQDRQQYG